ncbi:hypothetical protein MA16_Dca002783 [Dendrobium catenatum]|uniref:Uncharacterized protein n=1 Tax=Dendrobium catenatum TaxID=906689 RepID=A0A2I0X8Q9_9ASPA|nr:hypothetical protein MA16_Dca002783 [Dendrobium catenatum]
MGPITPSNSRLVPKPSDGSDAVKKHYSYHQCSETIFRLVEFDGAHVNGRLGITVMRIARSTATRSADSDKTNPAAGDVKRIAEPAKRRGESDGPHAQPAIALHATMGPSAHLVNPFKEQTRIFHALLPQT